MAEIDQRIYLDYIEARQKAKDASSVADALAADIKRMAGADEVLTVNGTKVGTFERIKKFASQKFIKDNPDLAEAFTVQRYVSELDVAKIKRMLPDEYAKYQVRQLVIEG